MKKIAGFIYDHSKIIIAFVVIVNLVSLASFIRFNLDADFLTFFSKGNPKAEEFHQLNAKYMSGETISVLIEKDGSLLDKDSLLLDRRRFAELLLQNQGLELARFDTRQTTFQPSNRAGQVDLISRYLRSVLQFRCDLAYVGLESGFSAAGSSWRNSVGARWNYNQGTSPPKKPLTTDAPPGGSQPWLLRAMKINPSLKVFVATGLYDSLNSCVGNAYLVSELDPEFRENFTMVCYKGGHAMYHEGDVRIQMKNDIADFIQRVLAGDSAS